MLRPEKGKSQIETNWELVENKWEIIEIVSKVRGMRSEESVRSGKRPEGAMSP